MRLDIAILMLVVVTLSACAATQKPARQGVPTQEIMDSWTGRTIDEVADGWGASAFTMKRLDGGVTYTWVTAHQSKKEMQQCRQSFATDLKGVVTAWSYVNCPKYITE